MSIPGEGHASMLNGAVFIQQLAADDRDIGVTFNLIHQCRQPTLGRYGVVVQEHEVSPLAARAPWLQALANPTLS